MTFETSAVGLDIDSRSIHLVRVVRRLGRIVVTHTRSALLPENPANQESVIRRTVESLGLEHEPCGLAVFGRGVLLNTLAVPPAERSRDQVAEAEIKRLGFLSEEPVVTDYSSNHSDTESNTVLIAMAQSQVVNETLSLPDRIGLQVTQLIPIPIALLLAAQHVPGRHPVRIIAHIRAESTHVLIGGRSGLLFTRRFEMGSTHFTEAISNATGLRTDAAEEARQRIGFAPLAGMTPQDSTIQAALIQMADAWSSELQSTISLWRDRNIERTLDDQPVSISGQDVMIRGFMEHVAARLSRSVEAIPLKLTGLAADAAPGHTVALGLALTALDQSDNRINLLPTDRRQALQLRYKRRSWLRISAILAAVLVVVIVSTQGRRSALARALLLAEGPVHSLRALEEEQQKLVAENTQIESRLSAALQGTQTSHSLQNLIRALAAAKHEDDWVTVIADSTTYFAASESEPQTGTSTVRSLPTVVVEGYTPRKDFSTVLTMIERLRHDASVAHADLVTDDRIPPTRPGRDIWAGLDVVMFVVEVKLNQP